MQPSHTLNKKTKTKKCLNRPRSIYQYSNMAPRLSGQTSIFGVVFFASKSLLGIEGQRKLEKFAILTRKPRSHARILIYRTWPIARIASVFKRGAESSCPLVARKPGRELVEASLAEKKKNRESFFFWTGAALVTQGRY